MAKAKKTSPLAGFETHGTSFAEIGEQAVGDCPFCGKEEHFYVNATTFLWDCKVCGKSGNFEGFLEQVADRNQAEFTGQVSRLAKDRKLPRRAFDGWGLGWDGYCFTLPVLTPRGRITDLRRFRPQWGQLRSTKGTKTGLLGAERIKTSTGTIWLCEGEWDAVALQYLLNILGGDFAGDVAVAVPGANVFKREWIPTFHGKRVVCCYDNDKAGEQGTKKVQRLLGGPAKSLHFIAWPDDTREGYDIRDFVTRRLGAKRKPSQIIKALSALISEQRKVIWTAEAEADEAEAEEAVKTKAQPRDFDDSRITADECVEGYRKWLMLPDPSIIYALFGAILANRIPGDPLWAWIVGSAGAAKSELLMSLDMCDEIKCVSTLTPQGLVSGAPDRGGHDPSLYAEIIGKVLILKDATCVFSMRAELVAELMGYLRDAYDGKLDKRFGTGVMRSYRGSFGFVSGVTPALDSFVSRDAVLGERFLKYRLPRLGLRQEEDIMRMAIQSIDHEGEKRQDLKHVAVRALNRDMPDVMPTIDREAEDIIIALARYAAFMRAAVIRDKFHNDLVLSRPDVELPTRLAKQLAKWAKGIALFRDKDEVGDTELKIMAKVAKDTPPDIPSDLVNTMLKAGDDGLTRKQIAGKTGYPPKTVERRLQDMMMLGIVSRRKVGREFVYRLGRAILDVPDV